MVTPLLYVIAGLIGGGLLAVIIFLITRSDGGVDATLLSKIELLERAQEREERMLREEMARGREEGANAAKAQREELTKSLESVRSIVDLRLKQLQEDNSNQIDKMRATVDEKLQGTLEKRLGESFKLVSDRLEQVHQGLGAMRQLASDVGGLQKVLTNVRARGGWGEVQLGALLEDMLPADRLAKNIKTRDDTDDRVEFAIKFALLFLPSEGLYAEAIRRVGLVQNVQRDCRVTFVGPTTLAALLNSLQMGFRTLAIQKRSSEVWKK